MHCMYVYPEGMSKCNVAAPPKRDKYIPDESTPIDTQSYAGLRPTGDSFSSKVEQHKFGEGGEGVEFRYNDCEETSLDAKKGESSTDTVSLKRED